MNKKVVILSVAMFAAVALTGCGEDTTTTQDETQKQMQQEMDQMQNEIETQQANMNQAKNDIAEEKQVIAQEAEELKNMGCEQQLELKKTQLALLEAHVAALENLEGKVEQSPDFAIETCRNLNPGLSVPECEDKVDVFMKGKDTELTETQEQVALINVEITELETQCGADTAAADATATTINIVE